MENKNQNQAQQKGNLSEERTTQNVNNTGQNREQNSTTGSNYGQGATTPTSNPKESGQAGYSNEPEKNETKRQQEEMHRERRQEDVNPDREQTSTQKTKESETEE